MKTRLPLPPDPQEDPLGAARGILFGVVTGGALWLLIGWLVAFLLR